MKVLHANTDESSGGAARAAHRLYAGQRALGADATMVVLRKTTRNPNVVAVQLNRFQRIVRRNTIHLERPSQKRYPNYRGTVWSTGKLSTPVPAYVAKTAPDIVNLHWLGNGFMSIESLKKIVPPMVWTMHDMWPITGGCHYVGECGRFQNGCGACPQLGSENSHDISFHTWARKKQVWHKLNLTVVTPSRWLADVVRTSPLLNRYRIEVIPNGIDMQIYRPFDTKFARDVFQLPPDKKLILFGAYQVDDKRKGLGYLAQALSLIGEKENVEVVLFGANKLSIDIGLKTHHVGVVDNEQLLALLYSAADIFVAPSIEDNLPNTVMEALSCGTPCVAFNIGGMRDMIDHLQSGYLVQPFDVQDMAHGIEWTIGNRQELSENAREKTINRFDLRNIAAQYLSLYEELLQNRNENV